MKFVVCSDASTPLMSRASGTTQFSNKKILIDWHYKISNLENMNKSTSDASLLSISLDRGLKDPLHAQLAGYLRQLILQRRVESGERLPSSRLLADELSVSRVTVTTAFDQLISEGYAEGRHGSGVYVASDLPDYRQPASQGKKRKQGETSLRAPDPIRPFETSAPDPENFPHRAWARLLDHTWRGPEAALLAKPDPAGWGGLREAIASHLNDWRGISCSPSQIVITSGLMEAIELVSQAALPPGGTVLVEEPGHHILRKALRRNGLECKPIAIDEHGFDIRRAGKLATAADAIAITPSRHFPLGMTLPLARRLELLEWAKQSGGYIIEDDFDSEYRYAGQPLPALMSLDDRESVIYVGSFSKVMFQTLRLGFVVFPSRLVDAAIQAMTETGPRASLLAQPVLARFIETGAFATHIRRMRRLYARRQKVLINSLQGKVDDLLTVEPASGGMHIVAHFTPKLTKRMSDTELSERANAVGITAKTLSSFYAHTPRQQGLVLGYAAFDEEAIEVSANRLVKMVKQRK
ncbi:MAG: GntR family transcriptional regulator/MocR family aminotransferase [Alphaproteobacteria bacterium]